MAVGRVFWSSAILYAFLGLLFLHSSFLDVGIFGEAGGLCGNASECLSMNCRRDFFCLGLAMFLPRGTYHHQGRKFSSTRVSFYPNSVSTFNLTRLTTSGDINPNPGPSNNGDGSNQCPVC